MGALAKLKSRASDLEEISDWLTRIGENHKETRQEVIDNCMKDADCLAYYLRRSRGHNE